MGELPTTEAPRHGWTRWAIPLTLIAIVAAAAAYEWMHPGGRIAPRTSRARRHRRAPATAAAPTRAGSRRHAAAQSRRAATTPADPSRPPPPAPAARRRRRLRRDRLVGRARAAAAGPATGRMRRSPPTGRRRRAARARVSRLLVDRGQGPHRPRAALAHEPGRHDAGGLRRAAARRRHRQRRRRDADVATARASTSRRTRGRTSRGFTLRVTATTMSEPSHIARRRTRARSTSPASRSAAARPIVVQSMTNTDTADVAATVAQVKALADAGSELVRITVNTAEAAAAVPAIRERLDAVGLPRAADRRLPLQRPQAADRAIRTARARSPSTGSIPGNVGKGSEARPAVRGDDREGDRVRQAGAHRRQLGQPRRRSCSRG